MTDRSIARFQYSTEDAFFYVLKFTGLVLTGRTLQVRVKDRASSTTHATLTLGSGITLIAADEVSVAASKASMAAWPRGEYSADLVDITGEPATVMAVRFVYDLPGNLVYGVKDRKAFVTWADNKAYVTATGGVGPKGDKGDTGDTGDDGWTPVFSVETDGVRRVLRVVDWAGGEGTKPTIGLYVGLAGLVATIGDGVDIRGPVGPSGSVTDGDKGDITVSGSGTVWTVDGSYVRKDTGGAFNGSLSVSKDFPDFRLVTASGRGWRMTSTASGTTQGNLVIQASTDNFVANFTDALTVSTGAVATFSLRPLFGANTPWDSGNFNPASYAPLESPTFTGLANGYRFRALAFDIQDPSAGADLKTGRWIAGGGLTKYEILNDAYSAVLFTAFSIDHSTGQTSLPIRPLFGANTPWDSGNLGAFVGDAGGGGSQGLVPSPSAGDAAAGKVLGASGAWVTPSAGVSAPQGRLTAASGVSVMADAVAGGTTVYYTPHVGQSVPLYDGTRTAMRDLGGELSQALTDTTKSPAAAAANANYDMFAWLDGATPRCTRGPAWASATDPGTGAGTTEIELFNGFWVNKYAITNGPAARRGLYVGSIRTNGSAQIDWSLGAGAAGGGAANLTIWNAFNQVEHMIMVRDTTASWAYSSSSYRAMNGSNGNRINLLAGRGLGSIRAEALARITNGGGFGVVDLALDSTTIPATGAVHDTKASTDSVSKALFCGRIGVGFHYLQALEAASSAQTFYAGGDQQALSAVWVA